MSEHMPEATISAEEGGPCLKAKAMSASDRRIGSPMQGQQSKHDSRRGEARQEVGMDSNKNRDDLKTAGQGGQAGSQGGRSGQGGQGGQQGGGQGGRSGQGGQGGQQGGGQGGDQYRQGGGGNEPHRPGGGQGGSQGGRSGQDNPD